MSFGDWVNAQPVNIEKITLEGNKVTRDSFLQAYLAPVKQAKNYEEAIHSLKDSLDYLHSLRIFEECTATIEMAEKSSDMEIRVKVKEPERFSQRVGLQTAAMTDTGLTISGEIRNAFGGAEKLAVTRSYNKQGVSFTDQKASSITLSKPLVEGSKHRLHVAVSEQNISPSYAESSHGISAMIKSASGRHSFGWNGAWRDVKPQNPAKYYEGMSDALLSNCGTSVKSAVNYEYTIDHRDNPALPTTGSFFALNTELAGLGGDTNFLKGQFLLQRCFSLNPKLSLDLSCTAGHVHPWKAQGRAEEVRLNDRFFFGGPLFLRGFKYGGIGPRSRDDPLGGTLFAAACARLSSPLGSLGGVPVRAQVFADAGNLLNVNHRSMDAVWQECQSTVRASCGFGVALGVGGRLELNVTTPLAKQEQDICPSNRFQIGFGLRFL